ncbi:hydantoinase B/oxoprolinase family protein [Futiania mangrovi]|uniref:Hydantoinase B/oxoprolinase family protein n=1 Tax=Futiania mangrovi TaxID=2959716 RepID=A0A9J6PH12_9PROT|nr:hydantoinase B/oxoprolinase family protein [Futiania mangrovii]MCP1337099.1 hydantoinase B/oxoprolinase family protein [Futiania mangrovii]
MAGIIPHEVDPILLEVVRNKLDGIANEMELTLVRSAFSVIVKEALDASASLFTIEGEPLAQSVAIPAHLSMLVPMVRSILRDHPPETMKEGDAYLMNDPYDGASHLPDVAVVMPVFVDGRPIALSAALTHHQDIGGMTPASVPTNATEIFQEGIRIPPLRLRRDGKFDETLIALLKQNVRLPEVFMGDLNAQIACCSIGARRLKELAGTYGGNMLRSLFAELLDRSERMVRNAIRGLPDGTYDYEIKMDNDGVELDRRLTIKVAVTIAGDEMTFDFTGTSDQARGPINAVPAGAYGAGSFSVKAITDHSIPNNGGCFRPLNFVLPEGSLVNPREPAPVSCRSVTLKAICGCVLGALRKAAPDRVPADASGELMLVHFGGRDEAGKPYITSQLLAGGSGASRQRDGVDVIETDVTNCMNVPAEALEMSGPLRVHSLKLRTDSGGAGAHRGGLGCEQRIEILGSDATMTYRGDRHFWVSPGHDGGQSGAPAVGWIDRASGAREEIPSKLVTRLQRGDVVTICTAGGAGFGDPRQRDRNAVAEDIANGKIGAEAAAAAYGFSAGRNG